MKVSLNLAQYYSNVDLKSIPRDELLQRIGAQLGAVEDVVDWAPKFEGAAIVKVVSCEKHPNADKLSVCRVDDGGKNQDVERGEDGLVQVVCGAPNVHADMFAVWLAPGVIVPSSRDTDPFELGAREIRGVVSNGMMASASELGISDNHDGILDMTGENPTPGDPLTHYFGLDDFVIDCENKMFTHRPDCFGNLGVARELAGISGLKFESPDWYKKSNSMESHHSDVVKELSVDVQIQNLVPRYMAVIMEGVKIAPSPIWLQATLTRAGIRPKNNIVDMTNYLMHLTGQPLHAFDFDKVAQNGSAKIVVRHPTQGEKMTLLDGREIELHEEAILICDEEKPIALGGVMGGGNSEIDENTTRIIIESANFDMYNIRRTSMRYGLFTDAVTRFNKGQSPHQCAPILYKAADMVQELCDQARVIGHPVDANHATKQNEPIRITTEFINDRLGSSLTTIEIVKLLKNVEFSFPDVSTEENIEVTAPFWRQDIEIPEDIVEEIGRLYGYDKLPVSLPPRSAKPTHKNELYEFKQHLREKLVKSGANEVLTYSFVHGDLLRKTGTDPEATAYHLRNALSPDLQYYRTSLIPSLLAKVHPNIKSQAGDTSNQFALFEIGKAHVKGHEEDGLPVQLERLALVVTADEKTAKAKQAGAAYYLAKKYLDYLTDGQATYAELGENQHPAVTSLYQQGRLAMVSVNGEQIGVIGEFTASVRKSLKLPEFTAGFELNIVPLQKTVQPKSYQTLPAFPQIRQDLTVDAGTKNFAAVQAELTDKLENASNEHGYKWNIEPTSIFRPEDSENRKMTFRITLWRPDRTLTTDEASSLVAQLTQERT